MSVRAFRGRKIHFKNFIGFHYGVKLVRCSAGGYLGGVRTAGQVGDVSPGGTISLTVSCCLRQPRIASGATRFGGLVARAEWGQPTGAPGWLMQVVMNYKHMRHSRVPRSGSSGRAEQVGEARFLNERGSWDLLLAALGPNCIRAYPLYFRVCSCFSW